MNAGVIPWNIWNSACTVDIPLMALVAGSIIECVNSPGIVRKQQLALLELLVKLTLIMMLHVLS